MLSLRLISGIIARSSGQFASIGERIGNMVAASARFYHGMKASCGRAIAVY